MSAREHAHRFLAALPSDMHFAAYIEWDGRPYTDQICYRWGARPNAASLIFDWDGSIKWIAPNSVELRHTHINRLLGEPL